MRLLSNLSDTDLIERLRNGQEKAFEVLFLRYQIDVRKLVLHYVRDKTATEDLSKTFFFAFTHRLKAGNTAKEEVFCRGLYALRTTCEWTTSEKRRGSNIQTTTFLKTCFLRQRTLMRRVV